MNQCPKCENTLMKQHLADVKSARLATLAYGYKHILELVIAKWHNVPNDPCANEIISRCTTLERR